MGCIFIGFDARRSKAFWQEESLYRRAVTRVAGDSLNPLWRRSGQFCRLLLLGVLRFRLRQQPELGAGFRHVEYGEWHGPPEVIPRFCHPAVLPVKSSCAGRVLPRLDAFDANRLVSRNVAAIGRHRRRRLRQLIFIYPACWRHHHYCDGPFYNLNEKMYVRIHCGNMIEARNIRFASTQI